jgi:hypothetical protein
MWDQPVSGDTNRSNTNKKNRVAKTKQTHHRNGNDKNIEIDETSKKRNILTVSRTHHAILYLDTIVLAA